MKEATARTAENLKRELHFNKQKTKHEKCFIYNTWKRWVNLLPVFFACKNKRY